MKYILDTHTLLWVLFAPQNLSTQAVNILKNRKTKVCVSLVSFWEIATKVKIGKLSLSGLTLSDIKKECKSLGFNLLPISFEDIQEYLALPLFKNHKDPFDRMLIATAIDKSFTLISCDSKLLQYKNTGLSYIW